MIIGITGGIACGKSEVSKYLINKNYMVIDADAISKELNEFGNEGFFVIKKHFGDDYILDNKINKKKLGSLIFSDEDSRNKLNSLVHPLIINKIKQQIALSNKEIIFIDAPLLYETKLNEICDKVIVVYSNITLRVDRIINRDNVSNIEAINKINSQLDLEIKKELCDYVLLNEEGICDLQSKIDKLLEEVI